MIQNGYTYNDLEDFIFNEEALSFEEFELKMLFTENVICPIEDVNFIEHN